MEWQHIRPDVRQKIYCEGSRQIRLVEFDTSDGAEQWCEAGHIGYVLKGSLSISFDGEVIFFRAGDGLFIPSGAATKHRSVSIISGTQLLMVEDV
jgi:quercetin dioxygenase-like cupin family protein